MTFSETRFRAVVLFAALLLVVAACQGKGGHGQPTLDSFVCRGGGALLVVDEKPYCAFGKELQVTGFQCPSLLPSQLASASDVLYCAAEGDAPPQTTVDALSALFVSRRFVEQPLVVRIVNQRSERVFLDGFSLFPFEVSRGNIILSQEPGCSCVLCGGGIDCSVPTFRWRLLELGPQSSVTIEARVSRYANVPVTNQSCSEIAAIATACSERIELEEGDHDVSIGALVPSNPADFAATSESRYGLVVWEAQSGLSGQLSTASRVTKRVRFAGESLVLELVFE